MDENGGSHLPSPSLSFEPNFVVGRHRGGPLSCSIRTVTGYRGLHSRIYAQVLAVGSGQKAMTPLGSAKLRLMNESAMERAENWVKGLKRRVGLERHAGFGPAIEQHPLPSGFVVAASEEHLQPGRPIIGVGRQRRRRQTA